METVYQPAIIENITKPQLTSKAEWRGLEKKDHGLSPSPEASSPLCKDTVSFKVREDKNWSPKSRNNEYLGIGIQMGGRDYKRQK